MSTTRLFYARALLVYGSYQQGPEYEQGLVAVMTGEDSAAWWNPLDTTLGYSGAQPYNTFGPAGNEHVWSYASSLDGIHCTYATLAQTNMAPFHDALRQPGVSAAEIVHAFSETPWGYVGDTLPEEIVSDWNKGLRNYVTDRQAIVSGPGAWEFQSSGQRMGSR